MIFIYLREILICWIQPELGTLRERHAELPVLPEPVSPWISWDDQTKSRIEYLDPTVGAALSKLPKYWQMLVFEVCFGSL